MIKINIPPPPERQDDAPAPDAPSRSPESGAKRTETQEVKQEGRQERQGLMEQAEKRKAEVAQRVKTANDVLAVPYEQVTQDEFKPDVTFDDLQKAVSGKEWGKVITYAFKLLFGTKNNVKGLGFATEMFEEGLSHVGPGSLAGIFKQVERMDGNQRNMDWKTKMRVGIVRASTETALLRRGYARAESPSTAAGKPVMVKEGDTLASLAERGVLKPAVRDAIEKGDVIGCVSMDTPLPGGTYLYLDKDGFPIHLSLSPADKPSVRLFRKTAKENPGATKLDLLKATLKPGQIILTNDYTRSAASRALNAVGRWVQAGKADDEAFFSIHPAIVKGRDKNGRVIVIELERGGQREIALDDLAGPGKKVGSLAVCNLPDPSQGAKLAEAASRLKMDYSFKRAWQYVTTQSRHRAAGAGSGMGSSDRSAGVCFDRIKHAAADAGIKELAEAANAFEMFKRLEVEYAVEL